MSANGGTTEEPDAADDAFLLDIDLEQYNEEPKLLSDTEHLRRGKETQSSRHTHYGPEHTSMSSKTTTTTRHRKHVDTKGTHEESSDKPSDSDVQALREHFGHLHFKPLQWKIVRATDRGHDTCCVMATGFGKSLCYQFRSIATGTQVSILFEG